MSTLETAINVLRQLAATDSAELSVSAVAARQRIDKSTASRLLHKMGECGILRRVQSKYVMSGDFLPTITQLARGVSLHHQLNRAASALSRDTGHTTYVSVLLKESPCVQELYAYAGRHALKVATKPGDTCNAARTSTGRAILSRLNDDVLKAMLPQFVVADTEHLQSRGQHQLWDEIRTARKDHFAVAIDEAYDGVGSVGCAILDTSTFDVAAICITFPSSPLKYKTINELIKSVLSSARIVGEIVQDPYWISWHRQL